MLSLILFSYKTTPLVHFITEILQERVVFSLSIVHSCFNIYPVCNFTTKDQEPSTMHRLYRAR